MVKKTLVVYYSLTGNTQFIAETIRDTIDADVQVVKPIKDLNPSSGTRFLWGGMQSTMKTKPNIEDLKYDPLEYDLIIIGTPVWAWSFSPPIRSYMSKFDFSGKDIALWVCCDGDGIKAMSRFKDALKSAKIVGTNIFQKALEVNPDETKNRATKWAKELTGSN